MDFDDIQGGRQPRPVQPQPVKRASQQPTPQPATTPSSKQFSLAKLYGKHKKVFFIAIGFVGVVIIALALIPSNDSTQKPSYKTVLPTGESITQLGGWKIVSPPESDPVYAYADTIDGTAVTVSQQPAPKDSDGKPEPVASIAEKFFATEKIESTDAYLGTSSKGPQSALFVRKGTLVMIKSQENISNKSWAAYINNLR